MTNYVYRKDNKGEMRVIGYLSPEGHEHHYCTIRHSGESYKQEIQSHRNRCCKNKLGFYVPVSTVKEQLKADNLLLELGKRK